MHTLALFVFYFVEKGIRQKLHVPARPSGAATMIDGECGGRVFIYAALQRRGTQDCAFNDIVTEDTSVGEKVFELVKIGTNTDDRLTAVKSRVKGVGVKIGIIRVSVHPASS